MQTVFTFLNVSRHTNRKAEADLRQYDRHMVSILESLHSVITLSLIVQFG